MIAASKMISDSPTKTVIVAFYNVFPPISGAATVSYNIARFLPGEKYLFHLDQMASEAIVGKDIKSITFPSGSNNHLAKTIALLRHITAMAKRIKQLQPDTVILEGASWTVYYLAFMSCLKLFRCRPQVIYHAHNVEYLLRKQKNGFLVAWLTRWAEGLVLTKSDLATAVSEVDADQFQRLYGIKTALLANGVDTEKFDKVTSKQVCEIKKKYHIQGKSVLFMGLTTFKPNKEAIDFLLHRVFPGVIKIWPTAKLVIIGGNIAETRPWLLNPGSIPFEDVPAFIKACNVCVAPIFSGSGTRLKILEYMAAGKPVVTTRKGAEGILCQDGKNILFAENAAQFVDQIADVLSRPQFFQNISEQGRRMAARYYSWDKIIEAFQRRLIESDKRVRP